MLTLDVWSGGVAGLVMETVHPRSAQQRLRFCQVGALSWAGDWAGGFGDENSEHVNAESQRVGAGCRGWAVGPVN